MESFKQESDKYFDKSLIKGDTTQARGRMLLGRFSRKKKKSGTLAVPSSWDAFPHRIMWLTLALPSGVSSGAREAFPDHIRFNYLPLQCLGPLFYLICLYSTDYLVYLIVVFYLSICLLHFFLAECELDESRDLALVASIHLVSQTLAGAQ